MKERGFTLIEVLASIVLLSLLAITVSMVVGGSLRVSANQEATTKCILLADEKMDETKGKVLGRSTDPGYAYGWNHNYNETGGSFPSPNSDYRYNVSDPDYPVSGYIRRISVTVWNDANGDGSLDSDEKSLTLDTKITRRD